MLVVRAANLRDLDALKDLARLAGRGFTSLPQDDSVLSERLLLAEKSFAGKADHFSAWYTVVLEDLATGRVEGVASVRGAIGRDRPHYSFRQTTITQYTAGVGLRADQQALVLVNECSGWSEVGSLFLRREARSGGAGSLLATSRYLLIAADPARFSGIVMAELRGYFAEDGTSPFWEHVASKFFPLTFDQAVAMLATTDGQFITDLAPRHPIYLALISDEVREKVGEVHPEGRAALAMLEKEGFSRSGLIDVFDAGPTVACRRDHIETVRRSSNVRLRVTGDVMSDTVLISTGQLDNFRCVKAPAQRGSDEISVSAATARALGVEDGAIVKVRN